MGITAAVVRVAADVDTAPYTQDITTVDMGGLTPKAAVIVATRATVDGTPANEAFLSKGAVTGAANRWVVNGQSEHGQATTNTDVASAADHVVRILDVGAQTIDGEADFSAWITNGIRINWTDAPTAGFLLTVHLFGGTDLSAHANSESLGDTVDLATDITAPGFEPHLIIAAQARASFTQRRVGFGIAHNDGVGGITQRGIGTNWRSGIGTSDSWAYVRNDAVVVDMVTALDWYGELSDFDANGFTVTTRNNGANNTPFYYLALRLASAAGGWVGTYTTPTSTGADAEAGVGFTPQYVFMIENFAEAVNTAYGDNRGGTIGFAGITSGAQYADSNQDEDGQATSDTQSLSDDTAIQLPDDDGSAGLTASFTSFDANGWTLNYSAAEAAAKLFFALAIKVDAAPAAGIEIFRRRIEGY